MGSEMCIRDRLGVGPNELASLVVLLAMLRARLASARPERHFYTLSISWGMKIGQEKGGAM